MNASSTITHTPAPAVTTGVVAHGLMALGLHMANNHLPLYMGLTTPDCLFERDRRMDIHLRDEDLATWASSINVTGTLTLHDSSKRYPWEENVLGLLPDSGVRVRLFVLRDQPRLEAVQS